MAGYVFQTDNHADPSKGFLRGCCGSIRGVFPVGFIKKAAPLVRGRLFHQV
jgi:hypothetical protein